MHRLPGIIKINIITTQMVLLTKEFCIMINDINLEKKWNTLPLICNFSSLYIQKKKQLTPQNSLLRW